jgi:hypothetical protein
VIKAEIEKKRAENNELKDSLSNDITVHHWSKDGIFTIIGLLIK